ncbi:hypothetical protein TNCV_1302752 [Trichonephila clavipes]|nr:hypothetical protein TNCV_1302752 [Trichonephila clavipes]
MLPAIEKRRSQGTVFSDESRFHLCPDDHRKRVLRYQGQRVDPAFNTGPQAEVMVRPILLTGGLLWSSLEAHLQSNGASTTF